MKRILIIGATSAIATACARIWAAQGHSLFVVGRDSERLRALVGDLSVRGASQCTHWVMDVGRLDGYEPMFEVALDALGALDVVLIAHGTLPNQSACESDPELMLQEFSTNCTSTLALLAIIGNRLEAQGSGAIGVITSVAGDRGRPSNYVYRSAKAAVSVFCEGLRARLFNRGVTLTDIRPGFVATPMTEGLSLPGALVAQPEAVARRITAAVERGADVVYAPAFWWWIMIVIRNIPRFIFKRISL